MAEISAFDAQNYTVLEKQLRYVASRIRVTGRQMLTEVGITPPQFVALQWISEEEGITIGELSSHLFLAFSTTTDLIDKLEEKEFVERKKDTKDKRLVRIFLKENGEAIIQSVIRKRQEFLGEHLATIPSEFVEAFQQGLGLLYASIKKEQGHLRK
ncbi:MarR family transcriptional regulator [Pullulanibacillus sp. KACC 23026]|uniref:MarR family winged helix-turn-helix transcriptional regulator n=1 Tax=Pullulanibacillus sp. KACC 23026 TaxID=3028315 RepID=UPI0023B1FEE6|nr:MarR family transcriptional regulator [Pullulanibacillus sp. KACC 23026]WEG13951.1 MarR family transcriptional regulator [Pullulanibacillus sp. KACC 23026]